MLNVIDYIPGNTLLHRLNPVTKLALAAAIIIATAAMQAPGDPPTMKISSGPIPYELLHSHLQDESTSETWTGKCEYGAR